MEDFEKIREVTLEEAQKILPKNIAYLTMKDGEVIVVNGLDHDKFDKKEKEYEEWTEEQYKLNTPIKNFDTKLMKIQEDAPENERDSNLLNKEGNLRNQNNIQINLNKKCYEPFKNNPLFMNNNNRIPYQIKDNQININHSLNKHHFDYRRNINQFPLCNNYRNTPIIKDPREDYFINLDPNQVSQYRANPSYITYDKFKPKTIDNDNQAKNNMQKKGINKYVRYSNHNYVEIKEKK